jgi:hypothetical protein
MLIMRSGTNMFGLWGYENSEKEYQIEEREPCAFREIHYR